MSALIMFSSKFTFVIFTFSRTNIKIYYAPELSIALPFRFNESRVFIPFKECASILHPISVIYVQLKSSFSNGKHLLFID